jgi:pimeloyl-ACP methyl ester carboxylesterase
MLTDLRGSLVVPVPSTPAMIAMMERNAALLAQEQLASGEGTWGRHVETLECFRREIGLERVVLAAHDTGGAIGLRWACDHPDAVAGLVISNTGFFPDYEFAEIAKVMRTPLQATASRDAYATLSFEVSSGIDERAVDEYWKAFTTAAGRRGMLELYRSFDLDELAPYQGRLAALEAPVLIFWGQQDDYLPTTGRVSQARPRAPSSCRSRTRAIPRRGRAGAPRARGDPLPSPGELVRRAGPTGAHPAPRGDQSR